MKIVDFRKRYHYSSCERKEVQGFSTHLLFIGKK